MRLITNFVHRVRRMSAKQAVIAGVFMLALTGAAGYGLQQRQHAGATGSQDCSQMSILRCGAATPKEYISKLKKNSPSDIQKISANFSKDLKLKSSDYDRFAKTARMGYAYKDGRVVVDGQTVMTDGWSIGRLFKDYGWKYEISGKTYWASSFKEGFAKAGHTKIPVMVMFNDKGEVEYAALSPCGNVVGGKKVKVKAECKSLTMKEVGLNKYELTTNTYTSSLATVEKVEYFLNGKKIGESKNASDNYKIAYTIAESGKVTSKVHVKVPGKQTIVVTSTNCEKEVTYKKPYYECTQLDAVVRSEDEDTTTYRVTAVTKQGNGATLKNADFIVDGKTVASDVIEKDGGNIFYDVVVENGKSHSIVAKPIFTLEGKEVAAKEDCETTVTPAKPYYACDLLRATALDETKLAFRYTVEASYGDGATLESADFTVWTKGSDADKKTEAGVTQKDADGNIYQDFTFEADGAIRVVQATVNFNVKGNVKSVTCEAEVTPEEAPKCTVPGKEHLPPDSPECEVEPCDVPGKEHLPKDSELCVEDEVPEKPGKETPVEQPEELPHTGAASVFGLFASATGAGAAAHRLIVRRQK